MRDERRPRGVRVGRVRWLWPATALSLCAVWALTVPWSTDSRESTGSGRAASNPPADPALQSPRVDMGIVRASEDEGKTVNITLDDGPHPRWTPEALKTLKRFHAKAVFCLTGPNAAAHPDLVKKIVSDGHRLCNHSMSHDTAMDKKPVEYQKKEIDEAKRLIERAAGNARVHYYRAPGGAFTPESRRIAASHGMRNLGWNVDPGDYAKPGADTIMTAVKSQLSRGQGPTVLLHDGGGDRSQTLEALRGLLPWLTEEGYAFSFPKAG
ncbi:polysaccharide deacetylase family protein [Streptomyces sp. NPDC086787]|uniref:polysaccharide deacetylase family protein n=1 Tax=Streptomyces sp. NPDC086787 TaxID=3365759 RepID=UPI00380377A7